MIKKIFIVHHSHTDIGYTDIQKNVFVSQMRFLDEVLDYCQRTDNYPDKSKFRWTCETSWPVKKYFETRPERIEEFIKRVKEGRIEITGLYLNMTDLFSLEMIVRSLYFIQKLKEKYGIKICTAMNCDINGLSWNLPQILNKVGIRYLLMATNEIRSFVPDVPVPFYWVAPDNSRVLVWNASREFWYAEGLNLGFGKSYQNLKENLPGFLARAYKNYPYDSICIQVAMDNHPPILEIAKTVEEWNEKEKNPQIIFSTPRFFFSYMERRYGKKFSAYKLAWPDWWADGNGSCSYETSLCLNNSRRVIENEAIRALLNLKGVKYPQEELNRIQENLFFFAEHTFGYDGSVREPFSVQTFSQWALKSNFAYQPACENERIGEESRKLLDKEFPHVSPEKTKAPLQRRKPKDLILENDFYRLAIDETIGGVKSIYDRKLKEELVDQRNFYKLNQYVYENIASKEGRNAIWDEDSSQPLWAPERKKNKAQFIRYNSSLKSAGVFESKDIKKIVLTLSGRGCQKIISEITLPCQEKRIEITNTLWKKETVKPEGIYFAFPFNFQEPEIKISGPGKAIYQPEKEQLPGTARDYFSLNDWVTLSDKKKSIIWTSPDAPLVQFSQINTGRWLRTLKITNGTIFSYAMNNYWYTNFKARQDGLIKFRYFLTSDESVNFSSAENFSNGVLLPAFYKLIHNYFQINRENLTVVCFKKDEDGKGFILRIKELNGQKTSFRLEFPNFKNVKVFAATLTEEKLKMLKAPYLIKPFEILTFYLLIEGGIEVENWTFSYPK